MLETTDSLTSETFPYHPGAEGAHRFKEGDVFGNLYVVDHFLGGGSMAEVYSAFDRELQRHVALKVSRDAIDPTYLRREGQILAELRHPGVVAVHNMGVHDGNRFVVLERLLGRTLSAHLGRREAHPFPLHHALDILIQLFEIVDTIHNARIVHRDLKPENIMVVPGGRVVVFDFGVALDASAKPPSDGVVGTPPYMAPELSSSESSATTQQDIYALGCIAFEVLTGRLPYTGDTVLDLLAAHRDQPTPLIRSHVDAPKLLDQVVASMMAKDPDERFQSVGAAASWLRGIKRGQSDADDDDSKVSVLIVDDDDDVRALLATIVERRVKNVDVRTACDGEDGITQFCAQPPDVLLFDLDMPKVSGIELAMHLAGLPEAQGAILCAISGHAGTEERALLTQLGIRDVIDKTSSPDKILHVVEHWVGEAVARKRLSF